MLVDILCVGTMMMLALGSCACDSKASDASSEATKTKGDAAREQAKTKAEDGKAPTKATAAEPAEPTKAAPAGPPKAEAGPAEPTKAEPRTLAVYPEPWDPSKALERDSVQTKTKYVVAKSSAVCPTREGAQARKCGNSEEDPDKGLFLRHGERVEVVGDVPFDGHWRAIREQVDGPLPGWVRADDVADRPTMKNLDAFDALERVAKATPVDGLTSEEIHALPPGTLVRWTRKRGTVLAGIRKLYPADPEFGVVIYLATKDGKPVAIDLPEDPETGTFCNQDCFLYGDCAMLGELPYVCEEGGHCDEISVLARTTPRRAGRPEYDEDLVGVSWPKDWEGYFMPIVQGLVVADRFAVWELDEPSR